MPSVKDLTTSTGVHGVLAGRMVLGTLLSGDGLNLSLEKQVSSNPDTTQRKSKPTGINSRGMVSI